ncbi:MAG: hypothetical protein AVDCRST_MAG26-3686 [uncultured Chloroflexia bacterium]|uniref:Uncharacterized protein n=1 Tax=uncultured Chloroflexia bacterium TaxID=1672391 RepID=A0A6J4JR86_9CHLR|nr:MAG: hypothetical protein AVDCRST_MAG26-3686 [uncultured Chloroflexia bacterium]
MLLDTASNGERRVMGKGRAATYGGPDRHACSGALERGSRSPIHHAHHVGWCSP